MAQSKPEKTPAPSSPIRILPMELKIGDRLVDEMGEWEVVGRPYTTAGGKSARVRVRRVGEPAVSHLRTWGAHERVAVIAADDPPSVAGQRHNLFRSVVEQPVEGLPVPWNG